MSASAKEYPPNRLSKISSPSGSNHPFDNAASAKNSANEPAAESLTQPAQRHQPALRVTCAPSCCINGSNIGKDVAIGPPSSN